MKFTCLTLILLSTLTFTANSHNYDFKIVPKPSHIEPAKSSFVVRDAMLVWLDPIAALSKDYVTFLLGDTGIAAGYTLKKNKADIILKIDKTISFDSPEAYSLVVRASKIIATANDGRGLHYALQTLRQLALKHGNQVVIPGCTITDYPAFQWRSFHFDESRHFHGMFLAKTMLNEMARLKMNIFHWHLTDDAAWRIEINKYPLLTDLGAKRDHSFSHLSPEEWDKRFPQRSYYTQDEIKDIVTYAEERGIQVIPEIEMPGHASAAIYAYPWMGSSSAGADQPVWADLLNVTDPRVEQFLKDVLDEVVELFPSRIIHIGGDEAVYSHWENNQQIRSFMKENNIPTYMDLQVRFINRMSNYLASKGCRTIGWNEITGDNIREEKHIQSSRNEKLAAGTIVQFWDGNPSLINKALSKGYDIVNSYRFYTYLYYPYEVTSLEKTYSFNLIPEGISEENKVKILGTGCQSWSEGIPNANKLFYQVFPRIAAHAETGWTPYSKKNYNNFRYRFTTIENQWKKLGFIGSQVHKY